MSREQYYPLLQAAANANGLPFELLVAQCDQESNFDPGAISSAGALGLMQLMPSSFTSCSRLALLQPATNVRVGAAFLRECVAIWKNETRDEALKFGLASYNGGPGYALAAQTAALHDGKDPTQWDQVAPYLERVEVGGRKPDFAQIQGYVRIIWANYQILLAHPIAGYGVAVRPSSPPQPAAPVAGPEDPDAQT